MIVHDPLYGRFEIAKHLEELVLKPEVQRLSQIRLLNAPSPSLAAIGDIRRFSHTLGVLYLCSRCRSTRFSEDDWRAFEASVILHDIGTPPFAHLFEYHLRERVKGGWSHELMIAAVLHRTHAPENVGHQMFAKRTVSLYSALERHRISMRLIEQITNRRHPLSTLLFGTIDLDNLDNVARMAWALGLLRDGSIVVQIASTLSVHSSGALQLAQSIGHEPVREWLRLRREVYEILNFDSMAIAAQAVLSRAIETLVNSGELTAIDWTLTDDQLMDKLLSSNSTKKEVSHEFYETLPSMVFCLHVAGSLEDLGLRDRASANQIIEESLKKAFPGTDRVLGYTIVDRGTFERELQFVDPENGREWRIGSNSRSTILYGFNRSNAKPSVARCHLAAHAVLHALRISVDRLEKSFIGDDAQALVHAQKKLAL